MMDMQEYDEVEKNVAWAVVLKKLHFGGYGSVIVRDGFSCNGVGRYLIEACNTLDIYQHVAVPFLNYQYQWYHPLVARQ